MGKGRGGDIAASRASRKGSRALPCQLSRGTRGTCGSKTPLTLAWRPVAAPSDKRSTGHIASSVSKKKLSDINEACAVAACTCQFR